MVHENELVYAPIGRRNRLENSGKIDLELIEVQAGGYPGEVEDGYHQSYARCLPSSPAAADLFTRGIGRC
jgi:Mannose-6-phosphate isomerase C-terminal